MLWDAMSPITINFPGVGCVRPTRPSDARRGGIAVFVPCLKKVFLHDLAQTTFPYIWKPRDWPSDIFSSVCSGDSRGAALEGVNGACMS